jgi:hypothetical protein
MKLHITTLNRSVFIPVDSSAKDGQERLSDGSDKISINNSHCTHFDKNLTIKSIPSITGRTPSHGKRVCLEKHLPLTRK